MFTLLKLSKKSDYKLKCCFCWLGTLRQTVFPWQWLFIQWCTDTHTICPAVICCVQFGEDSFTSILNTLNKHVVNKNKLIICLFIMFVIGTVITLFWKHPIKLKHDSTGTLCITLKAGVISKLDMLFRHKLSMSLFQIDLFWLMTWREDPN